MAVMAGHAKLRDPVGECCGILAVVAVMFTKANSSMNDLQNSKHHSSYGILLYICFGSENLSVAPRPCYDLA